MTSCPIPSPGITAMRYSLMVLPSHSTHNGPLPPSPSPARGGGALSAARRLTGKAPGCARGTPPRAGEGLGERSVPSSLDLLLQERGQFADRHALLRHRVAV